MLPPHRRRWSAVNSLNPTITAAVSVQHVWTGALPVERRCAASVPTVKGTGLPSGTLEGTPSVPTFERTSPFSAAGTDALVGALGVTGVMGADDKVQATDVRIRTAVDQGDPPRRTPPRC
jgi:hypothetical protein